MHLDGRGLDRVLLFLLENVGLGLVCRAWHARLQALDNLVRELCADSRAPPLGGSWRRTLCCEQADVAFSDGRPRVGLTLKGHAGPVTTLCFTSDIMVSGSRDGTARVWDVDKRCCLGTLPHQRPVLCVHARDGKVLTGSADNSAKLWLLHDTGSARQRKCVCRHTMHHRAPVRWVRLCGDSAPDLWTLCGASTVSLYDMYTGCVRQFWQADGHSPRGCLSSVCLIAPGDMDGGAGAGGWGGTPLVATARTSLWGDDPLIALWDGSTGRTAGGLRRQSSRSGGIKNSTSGSSGVGAPVVHIWREEERDGAGWSLTSLDRLGGVTLWDLRTHRAVEHWAMPPAPAPRAAAAAAAAGGSGFAARPLLLPRTGEPAAPRLASARASSGAQEGLAGLGGAAAGVGTPCSFASLTRAGAMLATVTVSPSAVVSAAAGGGAACGQAGAGEFGDGPSEGNCLTVWKLRRNPAAVAAASEAGAAGEEEDCLAAMRHRMRMKLPAAVTATGVHRRRKAVVAGCADGAIRLISFEQRRAKCGSGGGNSMAVSTSATKRKR